MNSFQMTEGLTEAEIQLLIAMIELEEPKETPNNNFYRFYPSSLEEAAGYFRKYREDWTDACRTLAAKQLLDSRSANPKLTEKGRAAADYWRDERPPIWYWYKEFYSDASLSAAYREYCEELYGRYLCQQCFSDMDQIEAMLHTAQLSERHHVLDLGCGTGMLAEYISDRTGASVHGIDYIPEAIAQARRRTKSKRDRLTFEVGNMDSLKESLGLFDAILAIDSLYMPRNLGQTLLRIRELMTRDGQILIFYIHFLSDTESMDILAADRTPLAEALRYADFAFNAIDFSRQTYELMQRKRKLAEEFRDRFSAERRTYIYNHLIAESVDSEAPYDPESAAQRRYLYHARQI